MTDILLMSHSLHDDHGGKLSRKRLGQTPAAARIVANYRTGYKARTAQDLWDMQNLIRGRLALDKVNQAAAAAATTDEQRALLTAVLLSPKDIKYLTDSLATIHERGRIISGDKLPGTEKPSEGKVIELEDAKTVEEVQSWDCQQGLSFSESSQTSES